MKTRSTNNAQSKGQSSSKKRIKVDQSKIKTIKKQKKESTRTTSTPPPAKSSKKIKSQSSKKRIKIEPHSLPLPNDFLPIHNLVKELREDKNAPIDSDGPEALAETHHGDKVYRFQILLALMLSSQTKDESVGYSIRQLQSHGLTVQNIHHHTTTETLNALIRKVGFHNNKTKYIKQTCAILIDQYDGDIPSTAEKLMKLPGVGPKMAYIVETLAFGTCSGLGVDTHMHRIFNQLNWVQNTTNPEKTREQLEGFLPKEYWKEINYIYVGFGQQVQQQKEYMLKKALSSTQPLEALKLFKKVGLDWKKESKKYGLEEQLNAIMNLKK